MWGTQWDQVSLSLRPGAAAQGAKFTFLQPADDSKTVKSSPHPETVKLDLSEVIITDENEIIPSENNVLL